MAFYSRTFTVPFLYDDALSLLQNPSLALRPIWRAFDPPLGGATVSGRPLLNFSFALNRAISGENVWSYHAVNLAIHIAAGLLLYGLVRRTWLAARTGAGSAEGAALAVAALWTWHPLQTESVTYVAQRAESLAGLFFLLVLYAFRRAIDSGQRGWFQISVLGAIMGAGCKETLAVAPVVVLLYDRAFVAPWSEIWRRRSGYYAALLLGWLVLAAWLLANGADRGGSAGFDANIRWLEYWKTQPEALVRYLGRAVWPLRLVFLYGTLPARPEWLALAGLFAVGLVAILAAVAAWRGRTAGFLAATFLLLLAPTSLVPGTMQAVVEHRMYLPLACLIVAAVAGFARLQRLGRLAGATGVTLALLMGAGTIARNEEYRSHLRFWEVNVARRPGSAQAQALYGDALAEEGRPAEAAAHYQLALDLSPPEVRHTDIALLAERNGDLAGARDEFAAAIAADPRVAFPWLGEGRVLARLGRYAEALDRLQQALLRFAATAPEREEADVLAGFCVGRLGRMPEAVRYFRAAIALRPDDGAAHYDLAHALRRTGAVGESQAELRKALALRPDLRHVRDMPPQEIPPTP